MCSQKYNLGGCLTNYLISVTLYTSPGKLLKKNQSTVTSQFSQAQAQVGTLVHKLTSYVHAHTYDTSTIMLPPPLRAGRRMLAARGAGAFAVWRAQRVC